MYYSLTLFLYLLRRISLWFFVVSAIASFLIFILDISDILRRAADLPHLKWNLIIRMAFLKLPYIYCQMLPFILLFSALLCLWMLNRTRELTVLKASGASFRQILLPFVVCATIVSFLDLGMFNPISRFMWSRYMNMDARYLQQQDQQFLVSEQGIWMRLIEGTPRIYRIDKLNRDTGELQNVSILNFTKDGLQLRSYYEARSAHILNKKIHLKNVWVIRKQGLPVFHEHLILATLLNQKDLEDRYLNPRYLSIWKIIDLIQLLEKSGLNNDEYYLHLNAEIARFFWMISMMLIAGIFMMRPPREAKNYQLTAQALFLAFILYVMKDFLYAMGLSGRLPIFLATWAPVAVNYMLPLSLLMHYEDG